MKKGILIVALLTVCLGFAHQSAEAGEIKGRIRIKDSFRSSDILVYIEGIEADTAKNGKSLVVDQRDLTYEPRVSAVLAGSRVAFPNHDEVRHNVYSPSRGNSFNLGTYGPGESREVVFEKPGLVEVLCNVHADMQAYVWVFEKAVWDVTGRRGRFTINGVPAGTHTVKIWHPDYGEATSKVEVSADGRAATLKMTIGE